jgi:MoxR-like ATPase
MENSTRKWPIFKGNGAVPHDAIDFLPAPPPWRNPGGGLGDVKERDIPPVNERDLKRGKTFQSLPEQVDMVNAALFLRRPLLITGRPGTGKSSLAYAIAYELKLGPVLVWPITTRTTLQDGLYQYDAIARLQDSALDDKSRKPAVERYLRFGSSNEEKSGKPPIEKYLRLGPLGTALLPSKRPRVLLIDEIDKSDIDLPNNLLNIFEEGEFKIEELVRETGSVNILPEDSRSDSDTVEIKSGRVRCTRFPLVIMTSNGERDFPAAFLRRCLRMQMPVPDENQLAKIVEAQFA